MARENFNFFESYLDGFPDHKRPFWLPEKQSENRFEQHHNAPQKQGVENSRNPLTGIVDFSAGILDEFSKWSL